MRRLWAGLALLAIAVGAFMWLRPASPSLPTRWRTTTVGGFVVEYPDGWMVAIDPMPPSRQSSTFARFLSPASEDGVSLVVTRGQEARLEKEWLAFQERRARDLRRELVPTSIGDMVHVTGSTEQDMVGWARYEAWYLLTARSPATDDLAVEVFPSRASVSGIARHCVMSMRVAAPTPGATSAVRTGPVEPSTTEAR